jgi:hypothetical protein
VKLTIRGLTGAIRREHKPNPLAALLDRELNPKGAG